MFVDARAGLQFHLECLASYGFVALSEVLLNALGFGGGETPDMVSAAGNKNH